MESNVDPHKEATHANDETQESRRDLAKKIGRFAAYAAPFTLLAFTQKANAATTHGPGKHP
jgi:hypothetical protein